MNKTYDSPAGGERKQFEGTRSGTSTTSALPDDLRGFTSQERAATDEIRGTPAALRGLVADFRATCRWGQLGCDQVLTGFDNYITSNDNDCARTDVVAANFEAAGGSGVISTVSDAAIGASLEANGVSERRPSLEIPAVQAVGNPPTSGYANDPVNTATGNFVENEEDLRFEGGTALLGWARSYSSLSGRTGGHGPGWASWMVVACGSTPMGPCGRWLTAARSSSGGWVRGSTGPSTTISGCRRPGRAGSSRTTPGPAGASPHPGGRCCSA